MKTEVIMSRDFNGVPITQRTSDKFFNATSLLNFYNENSNKGKRELKAFFLNKNTDEFLEALKNDLLENREKTTELDIQLYSAKKGRDGGTYMHPYLFVKFAMWLSPSFEVQVIKWVYDNLIDFRTQAGDYYKEMASAIQDRYIQYRNEKPDPLIFIKEAHFLNELVFGDPKGKQRNEATEIQLDKLNKLQLANIKLLKQNIGLTQRRIKLTEFSDLI